jgi:hypothetical protein
MTTVEPAAAAVAPPSLGTRPAYGRPRGLVDAAAAAMAPPLGPWLARFLHRRVQLVLDV